MRSLRHWSPRLAVLALLALPGAGAAQTGTVSGRVVDARDLQPIGAAQVFIAQLNMGVLTRNDGQFLLVNVPAGPHTFSVQRIGYRAESREVTVAAGQTATVVFEISQDALALDAVVVTGTPGATQRRAIGNVVGRVDAATIAEVAPITSVQDLLGSREPGLSFQRGDGNIGTGSAIRIRGVSSVSMGTQPLIYVDGIRVDNQTQAGPNLRAGRSTSTLDNLNPDDIESVEVIKGPAAATLYGTEASAGVIHIITKKGQSGAPQFDLTVRQGGNWLQNAEEKIGLSYALDPAATTKGSRESLLVQNIWQMEKDRGTPIFETGHLQGYNLSMRGGTDLVRYYLSTDWDDNRGIVDYNYDERMSLRANVTVVPTPAWTLDVNLGYIDGLTSYMQQMATGGVMEQAYWATPLTQKGRERGFLRWTPEAAATTEATREYNRFTGSFTVNHRPFEWLSQRLIVGTDVGHDENVILYPRQTEGANYFFGALSLGDKTVERPISRYSTLDYAASLSYPLGPALALKSSVGMQYYNRSSSQLRSQGRVFPSPAITSLAGAASTTTTELWEENVSLGVFYQQEVAFRDRIFLTAAVRSDDNSAFGANFDTAIYPKLSATWVVTDEPFWRWSDIANSLRLRAAWGKAGRQPATFAAVTRYAPDVGPGGSSALTPLVLGNPDVGPEVSTELEFGFDIALLNDRLTSEVTYYTQKVKDALLDLPVAGSTGFAGSQSVNLGQISNWGWEMRLDGKVLERPNYTFDMGLSFSHNENRIDDLGGRAPTNDMREGWAYPSGFYRTPLSGEWDANNRATNLMCDGGREVVDGFGLRGGDPVPCAQAPRLHHGRTGINPEEVSLDATLGLFRSLTFFATAEWKSSTLVTGGTWHCRFWCYPNTPLTLMRGGPDGDPVVIACAVERTCGEGADVAVWAIDGAFAKLREVSATYTLPTGATERLGLSRAAVTLAGRNLWTIWQAQKWAVDVPIQDPDSRGPGNVETSASHGSMPPLSSVVATFRVSF